MIFYVLTLQTWTAPAKPLGWFPVRPGIPKLSKPKNFISWFCTSGGILTGGGGGIAGKSCGTNCRLLICCSNTGCWATTAGVGTPILYFY